MAFRRRGGRRRSFKRRRVGGGKSTRRIARRAWKGVRILNKHIETKRIDNQNLNGLPTNVATSIVLNDITQGNSGITRIGDRIHIKSVTFKGTFFMIPDNGLIDPVEYYPSIRFILFIDRQPNGATPNAYDILSSAGTSNTWPPAEFFNGREWTKRSRFKILKEKIIRLGTPQIYPGTNAGSTNAVGWHVAGKRFWRFHHRFRGAGLRTDFFGNAGTIADITKNSLILMYFTNQVATNMSMFNWQRVTFKDG